MNINLKEFYLNNCTAADFQFRNFRYINEYQISSYFLDFPQKEVEIIVFDENESIEEFKKLLEPNYNDESGDYKFYLHCFFLHKCGYYIEQFPNILERPSGLEEFQTGQIRKYLIEKKRCEGNVVKYEERRKFVTELNFIKANNPSDILLLIPNPVNEIIQLISTRNASFIEMKTDEKLESLNNAIEYIIGRNSKSYEGFIDSDIIQGLITNDQLKDLRRKLHAFRHGSMVQERDEYTFDQKNFMINYATAIVIAAYDWKRSLVTT